MYSIGLQRLFQSSRIRPALYEKPSSLTTYTYEEGKIQFPKRCIWRNSKTVDNLKKKKKKLIFFFADIRLDSRGGIGLKGNLTFSVWLHTQVSDQLHALSDVTHGIQVPSTPPSPNICASQCTIPRAKRHVVARDHPVRCQESGPGFRVHSRSVTVRKNLDFTLSFSETGTLFRMNAAHVT